jgi:hypothetical protein
MSAFFFPFAIYLITLTFPTTLKTCRLFVTVAMLSHYQSPVNSRGRKVKGNCTHKVNYRYYFHFPVLEFIQLPGSVEGLHFQGRGDGWILKIAYFLEQYSGSDDW